jgi:pimeloyl-ACP methyl ester carboxylesterase
MYFNTFAHGVEPLDLAESEELLSLMASATELGVAYELPVTYRARNLVANGQRFHLLEWGDAADPLILMFHGANQSGHSWDMVSLNLSSRFHVIAVDQRGHGDSEWPRDGDMSLSAMAEDAAAILDILSPSEPPVIMAHSMGGMVALSLMAQEGLAQKLVIVDVGPETNREGGERIQRFVRAAREWDSVEDYLERVSAYDTFRTREHIAKTMKYNIMQRADGKLVSKNFPRLPPAEGEAPPARFSRATYEDVATIECPVLITRGAKSDVLTPEAAERFAAALPAGQLVTIQDCGHNVHSQNTPGFLAAVRPFLGLAP